MDAPELLALSDVPMARIVGDCIASPPALPLNGQLFSIPSPEVLVCKVQDLVQLSYFNSFLLILSYVSHYILG